MRPRTAMWPFNDHPRSSSQENMAPSRVPSPIRLDCEKFATTPDTIRDLPNIPDDHQVVHRQQGILSWCISVFNRHFGSPFESKNKETEALESNGPSSISYDDKATQISLQINDSTDVQQSMSTAEETITQDVIYSSLETKEGFKLLLQLTGPKAIIALNFIDKALTSNNLSGPQRRRYLAALRKLCGNSVILPEARMISEGLEKNGNTPKTGGGFSDLWEGIYNGKKVAIKVLRLHVAEDSLPAKKRFCKEAASWCNIRHTNILPFIGVASDPNFGLVSPWMMHGNIREYTKKNPQANRLPLLKDILEGLKYLHSENIAHGDLKGANILITDDERACLADFGLTAIISDTVSGYYTSSFSGGTARWMAPELLDPEEFGLEKCTPSPESDVYAFGMVVCEVISGHSPFIPEVKRNEEVISKVIKGDRPSRPKNSAMLVDALWPIAQHCWRQVAKERPKLPQVLGSVEMEIEKWKSEDQLQTEGYFEDENNDFTETGIIVDALYSS